MLGFLSRPQMRAIIGVADDTWTTRRDHLLLGLLYNTGARVSEIIGVRVADVVLHGAACVHLHGKGRKQRSIPLWRSIVQRDPRLAQAQPAAHRPLRTAAQPRRRTHDTIERDATIGHRRRPCG